MAMLSSGASGETLQQINKVLSFPLPTSLQAGYKDILPWYRSTKEFTLETANKVFVMKGFSILQKFKAILSKSFHSSIKDIDFGNSKAATKRINGWVQDMTKDKIKDLIPRGVITPLTRLVLVNAIYFKSKWAKKFDKTIEKPFRVEIWSSRPPLKIMRLKYVDVNVPMMMKNDNVFHANMDTLDSDMIELPYKGNRMVMQVLLPREKKFGIYDLEEKLKDQNIHKLFEKEKKKKKVLIGLPKFKLETTLPLKNKLMKLGLKRMFSSDKANFSGMTGEFIKKNEELYVSYAVQKAFIEVDEAGTKIKPGQSGNKDEEKFIADHPFIFYIRDKESRMLLFQGRVVNPLK